MTRRLLVTGCAGFIGARVVERLLRAGEYVVGVDNLDAAYDPQLKHWRLGRLRRHKRFRFHRLDVCHVDRLQGLFRSCESPVEHTELERQPFSAVLHLAARAGVLPSVRQPRAYCRVNCLGTINLLEMCRQWGINKFVLASTSAVYGAAHRLPFSEEQDTSRPLSPYAASKKAAEEMAHAYHCLHGLDVSVLRYFTVYGPAGRPDMSIFRFIRQIAEGQPIVVYGDGNQQRDFTYVTDIARGTVAALRPLGFEIINLGNNQPVKLGTAIETIGELLRRKPKIDRRPPQPADVPATWARIDKARQLLDWEPQVPFEEGLHRAVAWYRRNRRFAMNLELAQVEPTPARPGGQPIVG